jgi:membrane-associated protein
LKREHIEKTEAYYQKYGGKTVIIARFIPIVRTVAPFVAGAGSMAYKKYIINCVLGAALWVGGVTTLGFLLGKNQFIQDNFEMVIFAIIGISLLPIVVEYIKAKMSAKKN